MKKGINKNIVVFHPFVHRQICTKFGTAVGIADVIICNDFVAGETVSRALIDGTHIRLKALYNCAIFTFYKRHVFTLCFGVRVP